MRIHGYLPTSRNDGTHSGKVTGREPVTELVRCLTEGDVRIVDVSVVELVIRIRITDDFQGCHSGVGDNEWRIDSIDMVRVRDDNSSIVDSNWRHDEEGLLRDLGTCQADWELVGVAIDAIDGLNRQRSAFDPGRGISVRCILGIGDGGVLKIPFDRKSELSAFGDGPFGQIAQTDLEMVVANRDAADLGDCDGGCARDGLRSRRAECHRAEIDRGCAVQGQIDRRSQAVECSLSIGDIQAGIAKGRSLKLVEAIDLGDLDTL